MSVERFGLVDIVTIDQAGCVILSVSDHLDWSNSLEHQQILQEKLNRYLAFVESGEILEAYPNAKGRPVSFDVVLKFRPDHEGEEFLSRAKAVVESAGFEFRYKVLTK